METEPQKNDKRSLAMLMSAMFIFGTIGIFRRYIPLSSGLLAFTRGILGGAVLVLYALIRKHKGGQGESELYDEAESRAYLRFCIIGALIGFNWILLFEAYNFTTVSVATLCYYMEPTIVILLSPIFFREKLTPKRLACASAAILGMVFVSGVLEGGGAGSDLKGVLCGLAAAALYSTVVILNKSSGSPDPFRMTIIELFSASIVLIPYLMVTEDISEVRLTGTTIILVLIVGIVHTGFSYLLYFGSMRGIKAQTIALLSYIDPITALVLSAVILREHMSVMGMIGAVLILGAAFISEYEPGSEEGAAD